MCFNHAQSLTVASARLPETVVPESYDIVLVPNLADATFIGQEVIDLFVKEPAAEIVLNANGLSLPDSVSVTDPSGTLLTASVRQVPEEEQVVLTFPGKIGKGKWKLHLSFSGKLNDKLAGFYRSTHKDAAGAEHVVAVTQFEPNDARRAFPCFDEPAFKATFKVRLVVDAKYTAISNGRVLSDTLVTQTGDVPLPANKYTFYQRVQPGQRIVEFATTMKMSTYLVAFVVGELEATEAVNVNGTDIRIYHVPGKGKLTAFALKAAQYALAWYEKYFDIKYPGDKIDMIAVPDFAFGGMENLGCIIYRETALLLDEAKSTVPELQRVAEVVQHELAHMWFGDLVTMKWWNGLWLNEAFATFMSWRCLSEWRPEWDLWTSFGPQRGMALQTDGLTATRPIEAPVTAPAQALGMIDVITYRKGCSVLRMIEQYMGEENFRLGIAAYLKQHSYANTETSDLWDALQAFAGDKPVREIADGWIFTGGHPVVSVSLSDISGSVTLSQKPFKYLSGLANGVDGPTCGGATADHMQASWLVPVLLRVKTKGNSTVQEQWVLLKGKQPTTIYLGENIEWVVANGGGHGFYRVLYSPELALRLSEGTTTKLSAIERYNLVNDAWACVQGGLTSTHTYLALVKGQSAETNSNVWQVMLGSVARIHSLLSADARPQLEAQVRAVLAPQLERLGWETKSTDTVSERQLRGSVIATLGTIAGDKAVQARAKELFAQYKADPSSVSADIVPALVTLVAYTGGASEYAEFEKLFAGSTVPQEQVRYLHALAAFKDKDLLAKTIAATITSVRSQDAAHVIIRLLANPACAADTWKFLKDNWDKVIARLPEMLVITMVSGISALDTPDLENDVRAFLATHPVKGGDKAVAQHLESLRIAVALRTRESAPLAAQFAPVPETSTALK